MESWATSATRPRPRSLSQVACRPVKLPAHFPDSVRDLQLILHTVLHPIAQLSPGDYAYFASRLLVLLTSCEERRYDEWDRVSWWDFSGASHRSVAYQKFMADGLTRTLVAARAREMSARTGGYTLLQLLFDLGTPGREADRVLNGPTSDVWISPWLAHLKHLGVNFELGVRVEELETQAGRISGVIVADSRGRRRVAADWYVAAVPVEHMKRLANEAIQQADPGLAQLSRLVTRWMNGIVFFLRRDVPIVHGHVIYIDSPWSLTSISQAQFWSSFKAADVGQWRCARRLLRRHLGLADPWSCLRQDGHGLYARRNRHRRPRPAPCAPRVD